jgi:iron complex transport system ATP-binding protein
MIGISDVTVSRSGRVLLDRVSLTLEPGKFNVIIGPNGAGKSTLMKVICGEIAPDAGSVTLNDRTLTSYTAPDLARRRAVLPQNTVLAFPFTALEVVRMGVMAYGARRPEEDASKALARVGLSGFENRNYNMMSGGEQQRVQFARALAQVPHAVENNQYRALLLDEPTSSLDLGHQIAVLELARDFARAGGLVLAILHDLNLAAEFADQLTVLDHGRIAACGTVQQTICDDIISQVYGIAGTVSRQPAPNVPFVLPQSRHL